MFYHQHPKSHQKILTLIQYTVHCSLTDDETPTKPQQKLIESSKENSLKKVSMVASSSHNISLANASSTSQTIEVSNNLSLISSTPIKTTIDINNANDESSSTLHSMNSIEIDFLRKDWSTVSYSMFRGKGN